MFYRQCNSLALHLSAMTETTWDLTAFSLGVLVEGLRDAGKLFSGKALQRQLAASTNACKAYLPSR
jgi:hypothetical protein